MPLLPQRQQPPFVNRVSYTPEARNSRASAYRSPATVYWLLMLPVFAVSLWFTTAGGHTIAFASSFAAVAACIGSAIFFDQHRRFTMIAHLLRIDIEIKRRLANSDSAASSFSRHFFESRLEQEIKRSRRYGIALSLITVSLDSANHDAQAASTAVLSTTARLLRSEDIVGYLAPFQYAFCLPHTEADGANVVVRRLEDALAAYSPQLGVASLGPAHVSFDQLIETALRDANRRASAAATVKTWDESIQVS